MKTCNYHKPVFFYVVFWPPLAFLTTTQSPRVSLNFDAYYLVIYHFKSDLLNINMQIWKKSPGLAQRGRSFPTPTATPS